MHKKRSIFQSTAERRQANYKGTMKGASKETSLLSSFSRICQLADLGPNSSQLTGKSLQKQPVAYTLLTTDMLILIVFGL